LELGCAALRGREDLIFDGGVVEKSANSINRNWVGKRKLFFHSWWQRGKPILPYGKDFNKQKRRISFFTRFALQLAGSTPPPFPAKIAAP
jgi:hypothetical protein